MMFNLLIIILIGFLGSLIGWELRNVGWKKLTKPIPTVIEPWYEVHLVRYTPMGQFSHVVYNGPDLFEAKAQFKTIKVPPHCKAELFSHGHLTASR